MCAHKHNTRVACRSLTAGPPNIHMHRQRDGFGVRCRRLSSSLARSINLMTERNLCKSHCRHCRADSMACAVFICIICFVSVYMVCQCVPTITIFSCSFNPWNHLKHTLMCECVVQWTPEKINFISKYINKIPK